MRGVALDGGHPIQWDDLDENGVLSKEDEIAWQADLAPGEKKSFILSLLGPAPEKPEVGALKLAVKNDQARFAIGRKAVLTVGADNTWHFRVVGVHPAVREGTHPGARFRGATAREPEIRVLADGPVRKSIEVAHGYEPLKQRQGGTWEPDVSTVPRDTVDARQAADQQRAYATTTDTVNKTFRENPISVVRRRGYGKALAALAFPRGQSGWYKDPLGRVGPPGRIMMERNCGGWLAISPAEGKLVGLLLRRTDGIECGRPVRDETDGLQVNGLCLSRSFIDWNTDEVRKFVDTEVLAGTEYRLEVLLVVTNGTSWEPTDDLRQRYAQPAEISVTEFLVRARTEKKWQWMKYLLSGGSPVVGPRTRGHALDRECLGAGLSARR